MLDHIPLLQLLLVSLRERSVIPPHHEGAWAAPRPDAGYTTEAIIATALLAGIAIAAITALGAKVLAKVGAISLG
jgi:hypothetical protein